MLLFKKVKIENSFCFPSSWYRGSHECGPAKFFSQEPHSASHSPAATTLNCACEHMCFISVYFVPPLTRCVLRSLLFALLLFGYKEFTGTLCFQIASEPELEFQRHKRLKFICGAFSFVILKWVCLTRHICLWEKEKWNSESVSHSVLSDSLQPHGL